MFTWYTVQEILASIAFLLAYGVNEVYSYTYVIVFIKFFIVIAVSSFILAISEKVSDEYKFRLSQLHKAESSYRGILDCEFTMLAETCTSSEIDRVWEFMKPYYGSVNIIFRKTFFNIMFKRYNKVQ